MARRAETKVGRISIVPVHTRYVVVQYRSAAALGAVGRPSEIHFTSDVKRPGKGLKLYRMKGCIRRMTVTQHTQSHDGPSVHTELQPRQLAYYRKGLFQ